MQRSSIHQVSIADIIRSVKALTLVPACLALGGCSSQELSLGSGGASLEGSGEPACGNGVLAHAVYAITQDQVDALSGCEEIVGDLRIQSSSTNHLDLRSLASLRVVHGNLAIASNDGLSEIESLEGLEALEQVSALTIQGLLAPDLLPLSALVRVDLDPLSTWGEGGTINISASPNLTDLTGLGGLRDWERLILDSNERLASLRGLAVATQREVSVTLDDLPSLKDVSDLASLTNMRSLILVRTGLEGLDGLQLEVLRNLEVWNNPLLVDLDGLNSLRVLNSSAIYANPVLDHLPDAPELWRIESMQIVGNPELRTIPAYDAGIDSLPYVLGGPPGVVPTDTPNPDSVYTGFRILEIGNNPKLSQFSAPTKFTRGQYVGIYDNPSLSELDLGALTVVDGLSIRNNVALGSVDIAALDTVDALVVENNPALPVADFAEVKTFSSTIAGNADGL